MRTIRNAIASAVAVLAITGVALANQGTAPHKATGKSSAAKTTSLIATGKLVKFDTASNELTVSTSKGEEQFMLSPSARIHDGSKTVAPANLGGLAGRELSVKYTEANGQKTVQSLSFGHAKQAKKG
jgi:hypothetical protein